MIKHTITLDDAKAYEFTQALASSYGRGQGKALCVKITAAARIYIVRDSGKDIFETNDLESAVNKYNSI